MEIPEKKMISWNDIKASPWWVWIFIVSCIALPIATLGGAIPAIMALLGITFCVKVSLLPTLKMPIKLLCCFGIVALVWGITFSILFAMTFLFS